MSGIDSETSFHKIIDIKRFIVNPSLFLELETNNKSWNQGVSVKGNTSKLSKQFI